MRVSRYVNFGGYPEAAPSSTVQADIGRYIGTDIVEKVLLHDLPSLYGIQDVQELNALFTTLAFNTAGELSLEGLSQDSGVSKPTLKRYLIIGENDFPDVVLEVDYTTDVRPGKLLQYEAWGFPELWVVVPPGATRRRPAGVSIHRLVNGRYRSARTSGAFPGWTAKEIHTALTEPVSSAATCRVLERVGRTLGEREGTGPDDDPLWRRLGEHKLAEGVAKGRAEGRVLELAAIVQSLLRARGKQVSDAITEHAPALVDAPRDAVTAAALAAADEADFWRRLEMPRRAPS